MEEKNNIDEIVEILKEAGEGIVEKEDFDRYRDGIDLQSVHARVNNHVALGSSLNNSSGSHLSLIQNIISHEVVRLYKDLDTISARDKLSDITKKDLKNSIRSLEELGLKIAKAVQVSLRRNKKG